MNTKYIILEGTPVTKKNSQQIARRPNGQTFIVPSRKYKTFALFAKSYLRKYYADITTVDYPVNLRCLYYMPTRRAVDLVNLLEATCDVLVSAGILKDDNCNIVISHDGSRVLYDKERPRTEIYIESVVFDEKFIHSPSGLQGRPPAVKS